MVALRGSRLRAALMRAILAACLVLGAAIVYRLTGYVCHGPPRGVDVARETGKAYDQADTTRREIQSIERKAWLGNPPQDLNPEEIAEIRSRIAGLEAPKRRLEELMTLLQRGRLDDTDEMRAMVPFWLRTKVWILDARSVAESGTGLYIPMHRTLDRWRKARRDLAAVRTAVPDIESRDDSDERRSAYERVQELRKTLAACRDELLRLEEFIRTGLQEEALSAKELPDVEVLREETSLIHQAILGAGELSFRFRE